MEQKIKFGTDGWRGIIAKDFTIENVIRVAVSVSKWVLKTYKDPSVVIGYDCRFGGKMFAETLSKVLLNKGIRVKLSEDFVPTPFVSFGVVKYNANIGLMVTASHNPSSYNGIKLKSSKGGTMALSVINEVERLIDYNSIPDVDSIDLEKYRDKGSFETINIFYDYKKHLEKILNFSDLVKTKLKILYDPMYGSGMNVLESILPKNVETIHNYRNPYFGGTNPEPVENNLKHLKEKMFGGGYDLGVATDGDADRVALFDSDGNYVDSHNIILILTDYLATKRGKKGAICTTLTGTSKITKLAKTLGRKIFINKVGFKFISEQMEKGGVMIGGEESGGVAVDGHINDRDGIFVALLVLEIMYSENLSLADLVKRMHKKLGAFGMFRVDKHFTVKTLKKVLKKAKRGDFLQVKGKKILYTETLDGYKYFLEGDEWVMIRTSGTEPLLRIYAESSSKEEAHKTIQNLITQFDEK